MSTKPPAADRMVWAKRLNASLSAWAATLSWWRMILLALIVLIAGSWISERMQLSHHVTHKVVKTKVVTPPDGIDGEGKPCKEKKIVIGGKQAIVITEAGCKPATPASGAEEPAIKIEVSPGDTGADTGDGDVADEETVVVQQSTLGGWIGDVLSALLIAFFAYLAAAKIIMRKSAESDA
ncbi:MAG: hypothetical protein KA740_14125, partial [Rhodoferax sp.]|nr:hypothetical protein [Rhodoferax sp.]